MPGNEEGLGAGEDKFIFIEKFSEIIEKELSKCPGCSVETRLD